MKNFQLLFLLVCFLGINNLLSQNNKSDAMVLEYNTFFSEGTTIELPLGGDVNVEVNWGDGSDTESYTTEGNKSHTYATDGIYTVNITGSLTEYGELYYEGANKLTKVISFGNLGLESLNYAFAFAMLLEEVPDSIPSTVTDLSGMFCEAQGFSGDISNWDVSNVSNMSEMFNHVPELNSDLSNWDVSNVTDMSKMFLNCYDYNGDLSNWNVSNVRDMSSMFSYATKFNCDISGWDVSNVTNMFGMFTSASSFNTNISSWKVDSVKNMRTMFMYADSFNIDISSWNVSNVTDMSNMFRNANGFDQNIGNWDVGSCSNMTDMFLNISLSTSNYDALLNGWSEHLVQNDVIFSAGDSKYSTLAVDSRQKLIDDFNWTITDGGIDNSSAPAPMILEFNIFLSEGKTISLPLNGSNIEIDWGDGTVESIGSKSTLVSHTYPFDQIYTVTISGDLISYGIDEIVTGADKLIKVKSFGNLGITSLNYAFYGASNLKEVPIDLPLTITDLSYMFYKDSLFNGNVESWDVSNVTNMEGMFRDATSFSKNIGNWEVGNCSNMADMFLGATLSTNDYDSLLVNWSEKELQHDISFNAGYSKFSSEAGSAKQKLVNDFNWTVLDAGEHSAIDSAEMVLEYNTFLSEGTTIALPLNKPNLTINWGDGITETISITGGVLKTHTYENEGIYTVTLNGTLDEYGGFYNERNEGKLVRVRNFGELGITSFRAAFLRENNLKEVPKNLPATLLSLKNMFSDCSAFNSDISTWNVSNVKDMSGTFSWCLSFNSDLSGWNVSEVTDMLDMFSYATTFNCDLSNWEVGNVNNMGGMFFAANSFTGDLSNWEVSNVTNMEGMFVQAYLFNSDLSAWDVSKVTRMTSMFSQCFAFSSDLSNWNVSNVTNMEGMFYRAENFSSDLSNWDVSNVTDMSSMFSQAYLFNSDLSNWNVSKVTDMQLMFFKATSFKSDISKWIVSNVSKMNSMFYGVSLSIQNYNKLLFNWSKLDLQSNVIFSGGTSKYSSTVLDERQKIINDFNWTISDGGMIEYVDEILDNSCDFYTVPSGDETYTESGLIYDTIPSTQGTDSILEINLTIYKSYINESSVTECGSYTWPVNGITYTESGYYGDTLTTINGCDSVTTLNLTIIDGFEVIQEVTTCNEYYWSETGEIYTESGNYTKQYSSETGCDSLIILQLIIDDLAYLNHEDVETCGSYTWPANGVTYTESGYYGDTVPNVNGCDSANTLYLIITDSIVINETVSTCEDYYWRETGETYNKSGVYQKTYLSNKGCDSTLVLNLTISDRKTVTQKVTSCSNYVWPANGKEYSKSGTYAAYFTTEGGCDSTVLLYLTITDEIRSYENKSACKSYTWPANGVTYTKSGVYNASLETAFGCDSLIELNLKINRVDTRLSKSVRALHSNAENAEFKWINCSNNFSIIENENENYFAPTEDGSYAVEVTQNSCIDTSECIDFVVKIVNIEEINKDLRIYPNPTNGNLTIEGFSNNSETKLDIQNLTGQVLYTYKVIGKESLRVDLNSYKSGLYYIRIQSENGSSIFKVIKD